MAPIHQTFRALGPKPPAAHTLPLPSTRLLRREPSPATNAAMEEAEVEEVSVGGAADGQLVGLLTTLRDQLVASDFAATTPPPNLTENVPEEEDPMDDIMVLPEQDELGGLLRTLHSQLHASAEFKASDADGVGELSLKTPASQTMS